MTDNRIIKVKKIKIETITITVRNKEQQLLFAIKIITLVVRNYTEYRRGRIDVIK